MNFFINSRTLCVIALVVVWAAAAPAGLAQETAKRETKNETKVEAKTDTEESGAAKEEKPEKTRELVVDLTGDKLMFQAPVSWKAKKPRVNFTKFDLRLPKVETDPKEGRMTFTISGGGTKANIDRWKSQFKLPVGDAAADAVKMTTRKLDGYELSIVQIAGTFVDSMGGGPFAGGKKISRPDYIMRAIILTKEGSTAMSPKCFVKLVGPAATVKKHSKAFEKMVKSMKIEEAKVSDE
jgi:hypothetical protein